MAEEKNTVVIYADWGSTFDKLDNEEAGKLIKHFFDYIRDKEPVAPDKLIEIAFEPIKSQLKRDLKKWEQIKEKRSNAGKISAEKKRQQKLTKSTHVEFVEQTSTKSTVNDNVNVNVNEIIDKSITLNKNNSKELSKKENPFNDESFFEIWNEWLKYKKDQFNFKYKSIESENIAIKQLHEKSKGVLFLAKKIIEQSIANGYKGLFNYKIENDGTTTNTNRKLTADEQLAKRLSDFNAKLDACFDEQGN